MKYTDKDQRTIREFAHLMSLSVSLEDGAGGGKEYRFSEHAVLVAPGQHYVGELQTQWTVYRAVWLRGQRTRQNGDPGDPDEIEYVDEQSYDDLRSALNRVGLITLELRLDCAQENVAHDADKALEGLHDKCEQIEREVHSYEGCEDADAADLALYAFQRDRFDLEEKTSVVANHVAHLIAQP